MPSGHISKGAVGSIIAVAVSKLGSPLLTVFRATAGTAAAAVPLGIIATTSIGNLEICAQRHVI
jgi:hypothetical protein